MTPRSTKDEPDFIQRGIYRSNPAGTLTFIGLRSLDAVLQYKLLSGWGTSLLSFAGIRCVTTSAALPRGPIGAMINRVLSLGLDLGASGSVGLPDTHLLMLAMSAGCAAKQIYWLTRLSREEFLPSAACWVSLINSLTNSLNTFLFLSAATSSLLSFPSSLNPRTNQTQLPRNMIIGATLYAIGIALETGSEVQRFAFKDDPTNKMKVMRSGLWGWVRHPNFLGYVLWRVGYNFASSGFVSALIVGGWQAFDFAARVIPVMNRYCRAKYGEQWVRYQKEVCWALFPGIF